jgi:ubiquinone/menaquinone biosynthesis C-methylase UbiE
MNILDEKRYYTLIDKEKNVYELAQLYPQNRKKVEEFMDVLADPETKQPLELKGDELKSKSNTYTIAENVTDFTKQNVNSKEWNELNKQFLNYHKSLSAYTLLNSSVLNNYISLKSGIGFLKDVKVLDVGGGTGHTHCTFFQYPETIEYYLADPNLRLLHDHFLRLYPKLSYLKMAHVLAHAEKLPIKNNSFDVVLSISAIDHLNDYKLFIAEAMRVLKPGGMFFVTSHLDKPVASEDQTKPTSKLFSHSFFERLSRFMYYRKYKVGSDDHTLHLPDEKPVEKELLKAGFIIEKQEVVKRYFYFVARKGHL